MRCDATKCLIYFIIDRDLILFIYAITWFFFSRRGLHNMLYSYCCWCWFFFFFFWFKSACWIRVVDKLVVLMMHYWCVIWWWWSMWGIDMLLRLRLRLLLFLVLNLWYDTHSISCKHTHADTLVFVYILNMNGVFNCLYILCVSTAVDCRWD